MKTIILSIFLLLIATPHATAKSYFGLSAGMTIEQVKKVIPHELNYIKDPFAVKDKEKDSISAYSLKGKMASIANHTFEFIMFFKENKLVRISLMGGLEKSESLTSREKEVSKEILDTLYVKYRFINVIERHKDDDPFYEFTFADGPTLISLVSQVFKKKDGSLHENIFLTYEFVNIIGEI